MFLAEADGQLVGCCQLERGRIGQAYVRLLSVRPGVQGQGVSRALVAKAEHGPSSRGEGVVWMEGPASPQNGRVFCFPRAPKKQETPRS